jgi:hypothetical protein
MVRVKVDDNALTRKARKNLHRQNSSLPLTGEVTQAQASLIDREVGVLKAIAETQLLVPDAMIQRKGFQLTVTVQV